MSEPQVDKTMHIAVDGSGWGGQERGVAAAGRRLWSSYLEFARPPQVTIFAPSSLRTLLRAASYVEVGTLSKAKRLTWQQCVLPLLVRRRGIELLHCPSYTAPIAKPCRSIVTVHDLIAWTHPRLVGWRNALHLRSIASRGIRDADAICVPTDIVRRSLVDRFDVPASKVFVVPWGVDAELNPVPRPAAEREISRRFNVDEPFALFCGCIERKKNLAMAMQACADVGILLLIVGPWVSGSSAVMRECSREAGARWRYLGYVSASELGALYSTAAALVYPSFVEGFGLPTIEAMRCGCPVVASDDAALREVCGGAALHLPASNRGAWATALRAASGDHALRADLRGRGLERAARFTWSATVDRFAEAVRHAGL
jgi:glycosyltransferase involved in cell wall biosynthesis